MTTGQAIQRATEQPVVMGPRFRGPQNLRSEFWGAPRGDDIGELFAGTTLES